MKFYLVYLFSQKYSMKKSNLFYVKLKFHDSYYVTNNKDNGVSSVELLWGKYKDLVIQSIKM